MNDLKSMIKAALGTSSTVETASADLRTYEEILNPAPRIEPIIEVEDTTDYTGIMGEDQEVANTTEQNCLSLEVVNKSSLVSTMASELFNQGLSPRVALISAAAFVGAIEYKEDPEVFGEALMDGLTQTELSVQGHELEPVELNGEEILAALEAGRYMMSVEDNLVVGPRIDELLALRTEAYMPPLASEGVKRRFGYAPVKYSALVKEAVHALEATEYTVDPFMLSIAMQVSARLGGFDKDDEAYVLKGCLRMDPELAYVSEFKADARLRLYHASCHGPNGQASDRSRALMNLHGVPTDYDISKVLPILRHEMGDMVTIKSADARAELVKEAMRSPVEFIIRHMAINDSDQKPICNKPWSFVKACHLLVALSKGERPYLGMAVGLDAKCSGPQLGALMVGDQVLAQACGFSMTKVNDAYHRALVECSKAGFSGMSRDDIKKPFMGIFYGQGWRAFMAYGSVEPAVWHAIHGDSYMGDEDKAKAFHKVVTASFGAKMQAVRQLIKGYGEKIGGKIKHYMPDGSQVAMNYKHKVNIMGEEVTFDTELPDVYVTNNAERYKFINYTMKTRAVHCGDFARNGFVNLIQATDALLARLIICHLKRLGAQHIISVHDCFRVNMLETHLLEKAIKLAYMDLFGTTNNERTADMPMGTDILALYFEGANKALLEGEKEQMVSQFFSSGTRRLMKIGEHRVSNLIKALGTTYYFAK